jgi:spore maturation protein CgeB
MPVWGQELHRLLSSAKIVLNITRSEFHGAETGINLRIFEALAAGCFLLTDRCEEVESLFLTGVEIETFGSSTELTQKLSHYLQDNEARERIANQGHQAFLQRHTWQIRASEMLLLMK